MSKKHLFFVLGFILLLIGGIFAYRSIIYKTEISEFELQAENIDVAGVPESGTFILKSSAPLSAQVIEKYMAINPKIEFSVTKVESTDNIYKINPDEKLQADTVYSFLIEKGDIANKTFSWSYQVKGTFGITASIPGDMSTDVPTNSGIEITFNRDDVLEPEKYISIVPQIDGKFEISGKTVRFIPKQNFKDRTVYAVTVKEGLSAKDTSDVLEKEQKISFETADSYSGSKVTAYFGKRFSEFGLDVKPTFSVSGANMPDSVKVSTYSFSNSSDFIGSVTSSLSGYEWRRYSDPKSAVLPSAKPIFSGVVPLERIDYQGIVRMPQVLPNGMYLVVLEAKDSIDTAWFQVSEIASFSVFSNKDSLVWFKNILSGKSVSDIEISLDGKRIGKTGKDGVLKFETPSKLINKNYTYSQLAKVFFVAKSNSTELVIPAESEYGYAASIQPRDSWWDSVVLNKPIYLPTDTLRFWTILKSREGKSSSDIDVTLTNSYWREDDSGIVTYSSKKIPASSFGTVTGEMSYTGLRPGLYQLNFKSDGELITSETVTVSSYVAPAYKLIVEPNKNAIFAGEQVSFSVKAQFYDGTPVGNIGITYQAYGVYPESKKGTLILNDRGEGNFSLVPPYNQSNSYWPTYMSVSVRPNQAEQGEIEANTAVFVFGPHIYSSVKNTTSGTNAKFSINLRQVTPQSTNRGTPYFNEEEYLGSPVEGIQGNISVFEVIYIRTETGKTYNPIDKTTSPIYTYSTNENELTKVAFLTDSLGNANYDYQIEKGKTYKFLISSVDSYGRVSMQTRYVYGGSSTPDVQTEPQYYLQNNDEYKKYNVGDPISLLIRSYEGVSPENKDDGYIFLNVANGEINYTISDKPEYSASFDNSYIPNVGVWSGWWGSGRFHNSYVQNLSFDVNKKRLTIQVTPDKQSYKPGETVSLALRVLGSDKKPHKAEVNISALDEAVFSIRPDEKDLTNDLYRDIYTPVVVRTSNMPPYGGGGAERGGGAGDGVRSDIQEVALYKTITTDGNGEAELSFKLPDNITSWRLTASAVSSDLFAGKSVAFIPVRLPYFVDATTNTTYLEGDNLILRLRTFGTSVTKNSYYSVESSTLPFKKAESSGGMVSDVNIGKLTRGSHDIKIKASSDNGFVDTIVRTLKVVSSYFTKNISEFTQVSDGMRLQTREAIGETKLVFSDFGRGRLYNDLVQLSYDTGTRLDQKGTAYASQLILNEEYGEKNIVLPFNFEKYRASNGGFKLLPYGSDDLDISALFTHVMPKETLEEGALKKYFYDVINDKKSNISRTIKALYGLSAFREPILTAVERIIDKEKIDDYQDRIYIALTLDSLGAKEEARVYYKKYILPKVEVRENYAYLDAKSFDEGVLGTTLLAALSYSLDDNISEKYYSYIQANPPKETTNNFEKLLYIKTALKKLSKNNVSFSYKIGPKSGKKTLANGESFEINLLPDEVSSFSVTSVDGPLSMVRTYKSYAQKDSISSDSNLALTRTYEVSGVSRTEFKENDVVVVRLKPEFKDRSLSGAYQIVDHLPSGLKPFDTTLNYYQEGYGQRIYPSEINNQDVTFILDKNNKTPIYYYARVVSKGEYKAEPAILQSLSNLTSSAISNETKVSIK